MTYSTGNPSAPGYSGCVSEDDATPCGWYDYYTYDSTTGQCTQTATMQTAIQTVRGGSPTMTADMLRLTGDTTLPTITFPAIPMAYPVVRSDPTVPESAELELVTKNFMNYYGSMLDLSAHKMYVTYGTEQGMVATVAIKILELASTTCNRDFYVLLEAPAYGYDWGQAVSWVDRRTSSFYAGTECSCYNSSTCNSIGQVTISQRGWAPAVWDSGSYPSEMGDDGMSYEPTSTAANSPWIQTNVIPGNPIGRFAGCKTPQARCICDGVYWYPGFLSPGTVMPNFMCYSWAFSITKIYSAQMRAGSLFVMDYPAAQTAASSIMSRIHAIGNGLVSYMQVRPLRALPLRRLLCRSASASPARFLAPLASAQHLFPPWGAF